MGHLQQLAEVGIGGFRGQGCPPHQIDAQDGRSGQPPWLPGFRATLYQANAYYRRASLTPSVHIPCPALPLLTTPKPFWTSLRSTSDVGR